MAISRILMASVLRAYTSWIGSSLKAAVNSPTFPRALLLPSRLPPTRAIQCQERSYYPLTISTLLESHRLSLTLRHPVPVVESPWELLPQLMSSFLREDIEARRRLTLPTQQASIVYFSFLQLIPYLSCILF